MLNIKKMIKECETDSEREWLDNILKMALILKQHVNIRDLYKNDKTGDKYDDA